MSPLRFEIRSGSWALLNDEGPWRSRWDPTGSVGADSRRSTVERDADPSRSNTGTGKLGPDQRGKYEVPPCHRWLTEIAGGWC